MAAKRIVPWPAPLALAIGLVSTAGVAADELRIVQAYPWVQGELTAGVPGVIYDDRTYKFYTDNTIRLEKGQKLVLEVHSTDYQPMLLLRGPNGAVVAAGAPMQSYMDGNRAFSWTYLEFDVPQSGDYRVINTTRSISNGTYFTRGTLYAKPADENVDGMFAGGQQWGPNAYGTHHASGTDVTEPGLDGMAVSLSVLWLEDGDTGIDIMNHLPEYIARSSGVTRVDGNVSYLAPIDYGGRFHPIIIRSSERQAAVAMIVRDELRDQIEGFVAAAMVLLDQFDDVARMR